MLRDRQPLQQKPSSHRRAASRPMTGRQERLFLTAVFLVGVLLQAAAVLNLLQ
jgi:hypothetical protein